MQQRVSICRALIHDPSVLLMDEPFAALDAMTREELGFELLRIWDTDKKTVVFVTHNIAERIRLLADRVVAMSPRPGRIAKVVAIDLPRPRTIDMEFTVHFKSYSDQIRAVIYHGPERASDDDGTGCRVPTGTRWREREGSLKSRTKSSKVATDGQGHRRVDAHIRRPDRGVELLVAQLQDSRWLLPSPTAIGQAMAEWQASSPSIPWSPSTRRWSASRLAIAISIPLAVAVV